MDRYGIKSLFNTSGIYLYVDPPYLLDSRKDPRPRYLYELTTDQHKVLLSELLFLDLAFVGITHFPHPLYTKALEPRGWRKIEYQFQTRKGPATDHLWMNYPEPDALCDYRYIGEDYRQRENIARQQRRWLGKLNKMPVLERKAMVSVLQESISNI